MRSQFLLSVLFVAAVGAAQAQSFDKGVAALDRGDFETAFEELRQAAIDGHATSQLYVGLMYDQGKGVAQDHGQAAHWYRLAAEQGVARAQRNLAGLYFLGDGVTQDYAEASRWNLLAAQQGDPGAQFDMGMAYGLGKGVPRDNGSAYMWFRVADINSSENLENVLLTIRNRLSPEDLQRAEKRALTCIETGYMDCN